MKNKVILSLGANLGDEEQYLSEAIDLLKSYGAIEISKVSSLFKTEPLGLSTQGWYTNMVISGFTELNETLLLFYCKTIEYLLGRKLRSRWSEREIDIDILFFGNMIINTQNLVIPHPELHLRNFVLEPLAEIEPDFVHPILLKSIIDLLYSSPDNLLVIKKS
jgi:2-amino-4-hydroxy-6-hydroxymethyldihydropteridine diphosphokinase